MRNLASPIFDHSRYWSNVSEFVSAIAFQASSVVASGPLGSNPLPRSLREAAEVRHARVLVLALGRVLAGAALISSLVGLRSDLVPLGKMTLNVISRLPFVPEGLESWPPTTHAAVGAAVITVGALAVWWTIVAAWGVVVRADDARFFERRRQAVWSAGAIVWTVVAALLPSGVVGAVALVRADITSVLVFVALTLVGGFVVVRLLGARERGLASTA